MTSNRLAVWRIKVVLTAEATVEMGRILSTTYQRGELWRMQRCGFPLPTVARSATQNCNFSVDEVCTQLLQKRMIKCQKP